MRSRFDMNIPNCLIIPIIDHFFNNPFEFNIGLSVTKVMPRDTIEKLRFRGLKDENKKVEKNCKYYDNIVIGRNTKV